MSTESNLVTATEALLELIYVPPSNCSCHVNPPCDDCVENGAIREAVESARTAIVASESNLSAGGKTEESK